MTEYYPLIVNENNVVGAIGSGGNATLISKINGCEKHNYYLWVSQDYAIDVTMFMSKRRLRILDVSLPLGSWLEGPPYVHARTISSLEEYIESIHKRLRSRLRGKIVLLGFSGGKDSTAALIVLDKLQDYIDYKLKVVYVHIPYLEREENIDFVERVSSKLGVNIEVIEPPKRLVKSLLLWRGLPRRGDRWCTYLKVKPMRQIKKSSTKILEVVADRAYEAPKRLRKMLQRAQEKELIVGREFRPTFMLTLIDVVNIVKNANLIHPHYLKGLPRVACDNCPFKALYEFKVVELYENDIICRALEKSWRKWYADKGIPKDKFILLGLWRYPASIAKRLLDAILLIKLDETVLKAKDVAAMYARIWTTNIQAPLVKRWWELIEAAWSYYKRGRRFLSFTEQEG